MITAINLNPTIETFILQFYDQATFLCKGLFYQALGYMTSMQFKQVFFVYFPSTIEEKVDMGSRDPK